MKKYKNLILLVSVVIIVLIAIGLYYFNLRTPKIMEGKADFSLSSTELIAEFSKNKNQADMKYANKTLQVSGKIKNIVPVKGGINIELAGNADMETVTGTVDSSNAAVTKNLAPGQEVELKGRCGGYIEEEMLGLKNVSLTQSTIVTDKK